MTLPSIAFLLREVLCSVLDDRCTYVQMLESKGSESLNNVQAESQSKFKEQAHRLCTDPRVQPVLVEAEEQQRQQQQKWLRDQWMAAQVHLLWDISVFYAIWSFSAFE